VMKCGAAGFLNKPVRSEALLKQIHAALETTRSESHL
jgi:FixJ family two-component response regulator